MIIEISGLMQLFSLCREPYLVHDCAVVYGIRVYFLCLYLLIHDLAVTRSDVCERVTYCVRPHIYLVGKILFAPFSKPCHGGPVPRSLMYRKPSFRDVPDYKLLGE